MLDLTQGNITRGLLAFAIPVFFGNLFQLFYSLADTRIVGSALGESALAAVGATSVLCNLMIGFMNGMALGFAIPVARCFGAGDKVKLKETVGNIVTMGFSMTLLFTVATLLFIDPLLGWMNISPELYADAKDYICIIIGGMFATFAYNAAAGILRAVGDTLAPLGFLVLSSILNILMDLWFIYGLDLGVAGAAYATVLAQIISAVLSWIYMFGRYEIFRLKMMDLRPVKETMKELLSAGGSMAFMSSFVQFGTVALQTAINTLGQNIIVAHTAARKITEIFMMMFGVLGSTMATFAGQNYGAGKFRRIREGLKVATVMSIIWCIAVLICAQFASEWLIGAVTGSDTKEVLETGALYLKVDTCLYIVTAFICLFRNTLQGIGDHITPVISSFIELAGKVVFAMLLTPVFGYWGIIWSEPVVWIVMVIPLTVAILRNPLLKMQAAE
ncbi:MAG: MATE family efflux transporter [Lachnospiraceae bacterium]|nr:MATE family efflux transporter [Lachnospiraceae bacterium]